ncbi:hypothetical protein EVAR_61013_1 [Eumeta japonica]|uniref:Uncharacterized protein n=1 Tax=Eumeta variegata TaxID=151549 RepID=A0A4C1ZBG6_EUMVA|nr:hypothetical protein EVAR_61013_1 [Eumeta japonica]
MIGFNALLPLIPTRFLDNNQHKPDILDIALVKRVALRLGGIETLQLLNADHRPMLLKLCPLIGDRPNPVKTITNWKIVSVTLEKMDTPELSDIPNDIISTGEIDHAIGLSPPRQDKDRSRTNRGRFRQSQITQQHE